MSRIAARFLIEGRVQGVWFRGSTQQQARRLGIAGHAINLADGRVEVLAVGAIDAVDELAGWLQHGPPNAQVTRVQRETLAQPPGDTSDGFTTG